MLALGRVGLIPVLDGAPGMTAYEAQTTKLSACFREPIPEIFEAAQQLDAAVSAHLSGNSAQAEHYIRLADAPAIRDWVESILGKGAPYVVVQATTGLNPATEMRVNARMPTAAEKRQLHQRDGYLCRFCGLPVIRPEVRNSIKRQYPNALRWGKRNVERHAAFFAMWAQYDHLMPHARGGTNSLGNLVVTCAACNYGRGGYTLAEVGLSNPLERSVIQLKWDGLERFKQAPSNNSFKPNPLRSFKTPSGSSGGSA
jgi:hypothetical protein